jgi:plasmid stabilization system protein ParE
VAKFRFLRRAETDLLSIGEYTLRKWGDAQAARYLGELEDCCQMLARNPALVRHFRVSPLEAIGMIGGHA